jgi:hypothetical protein
MKFSGLALGRVMGLVGIIAVASLLSGLMPGRAICAQPDTPAAPQPPSAKNLEIWRKSMRRTPAPKSGCYKSTYPKTEWEEVPCTTAPNRPYQPAAGAKPVGGGGGDFAAQISGKLSSVSGSLGVTGVTSESGPPGQNSFSLQLNTNQFSTNTLQSTLCGNQAGCKGWQQYVYSNLGCGRSDNSTSCAFIQYWLVGHASPCPTSPTVANNTWAFSPATATAPQGCYINGKATPVPDQTIAGLGGLTLTGNTSSSAQSAVLATFEGGAAALLYTASDPGDLLGINNGNNWNTAEFNVFGDSNGQQAKFLPNPGSTIVVNVLVGNESSLPPICAQTSFTAESNDLSLVTPCCSNFGSITFTESNVAGATATCACGGVNQPCCQSQTGGTCGAGLTCDGTTTNIPMKQMTHQAA